MPGIVRISNGVPSGHVQMVAAASPTGSSSQSRHPKWHSPERPSYANPESLPSDKIHAICDPFFRQKRATMAFFGYLIGLILLVGVISVATGLSGGWVWIIVLAAIALIVAWRVRGRSAA